jgi:hypothetical protein
MFETLNIYILKKNITLISLSLLLFGNTFITGYLESDTISFGAIMIYDDSARA